MRSFTVDESEDGRRCDRFLLSRLEGIPASTVFKAFRKRNVRVNGKRIRDDYTLKPGDEVELYVPDEYLAEKPLSERDANRPDIPVIYEDENILIVSKPQGMPVHNDANREGIVLDEYLAGSMAGMNGGDRLFPGFPALCHRIDRNTGGLVILAKNPETLNVMEDKFKNHEIRKFYLACVYGVPREKEAECTAWLRKDSESSRVMIYDRPVRDSEKIITRYKVIKAQYPYALLDVEIVTGKTHQIRAHLAYLGYPVLGDGKYGINSVNRSLRLKKQALFSYRVEFDFRLPSAHLDYLNGFEAKLGNIPFDGNIKATGLADAIQSQS